MIRFKQGQVCRWRPDVGFELDGEPFYVVGVNYVARYVCSNFWEDWRPNEIRRDLDRIAEHGFNAVRMPVHWEYMEPAPGEFRDEGVGRLTAFFEMACERGLFVMPWFLVGVATGNYDISWRDGQSFFAEPMVSHAARHLRTLVGRLKAFPNVLCWDICDEPEFYNSLPGADKLPYDTERYHDWVDRTYRAIKEEDADHAITLGFCHFILLRNAGMDVRRMGQTLDTLTITAYPKQMDEDLINGFRSNWWISWMACLYEASHKGVFANEAPGWSDCEASEQNIAHYYRVTLWSSYVNGSKGAMPWVWNDFDESIQHLPPFDKATKELRFGIVRKDGTLKPAGLELQSFGQFVAKFPPHEWEQALPRAGVLLPQSHTLGMHGYAYALFHQYIFLRQAGLRPCHVWPDELDRFEGRLLFVTNAGRLTTTQWVALCDWTERGGTLVASTRHVAAPFNNLFGVTVEGVAAQRNDVVFSNCAPAFKACEHVTLPAGGARRMISAGRATVLCEDGAGNALVTQCASGDGQAVYVSYPPETMLEHIGPESLAAHGVHALFRAIAKGAGVQPEASCADPRVELDLRRHADGRELVIAVNHSRYPVETDIRCGDSTIPVKLDGCGVMWETIKGA